MQRQLQSYTIPLLLCVAVCKKADACHIPANPCQPTTPPPHEATEQPQGPCALGLRQDGQVQPGQSAAAPPLSLPKEGQRPVGNAACSGRRQNTMACCTSLAEIAAASSSKLTELNRVSHCCRGDHLHTSSARTTTGPTRCTGQLASQRHCLFSSHEQLQVWGPQQWWQRL
jgi:hypothetical protein